MKNKRKPRKENVDKVDFLEPIDISKFGGDDDPCFGKHHDLTAKECKVCGDSELCAIAKAQKMIKKREKVESETPLIDMEDIELDKMEQSIRKYIRIKKKKGKLTERSILIKASKKFNLPLERIKELNSEL